MKTLIAAAVVAGLALEMAHAAPLPEAKPDGGACAFATVGDYVRFARCCLTAGSSTASAFLGPKTVAPW
ncbi:hypothetical protein [Bradyrhizobium cenepequi]